MAEKYVLASVGDVQLIDQTTGDIIVTSKTLTDSGINFSVTAEDIRGGQANALLAQYFHDSAMGLTLTDALYSLEYLALNVGGTIQTGADVLTLESVIVSTPSEISVVDTPKPFGSFGTIGWYSISGEENWKKINFVGNKASAPGLTVGTKVCVKYAKEDASAEQFTVSSAFIPNQVYALLTLPLFKSGTENLSYTSSSKVGEVQVEIPNFILSGAVDLALTSGGASTTSLSGSALATFTGNSDCDSNEGYYAKLKQIVYNKDEFEGVTAIVIANSNIELEVSETRTLEVYALYGGIKASKKIDNAKLTFTAKGSAVSVGAHTGIVTASTKGSATIEVTVTTNTGLIASAVATVA